MFMCQREGLKGPNLMLVRLLLSSRRFPSVKEIKGSSRLRTNRIVASSAKSVRRHAPMKAGPQMHLATPTLYLVLETQPASMPSLVKMADPHRIWDHRCRPPLYFHFGRGMAGLSVLRICDCCRQVACARAEICNFNSSIAARKKRRL